MRILHTVENYLPHRSGMSEVVRQISEILVKNGHEVVVATSVDENRISNNINGVVVKQFKIKGNYALGIEGEIEKYKDFVISNQFDIITNFAAQQWATDIILPILPKLKGKKIFVPTGYSALENPKYENYFKHLKDWIHEYDKIIYLSYDYKDIIFARNSGLRNEIIIPNGASKAEFLSENQLDIRWKLNIPPENLIILHVSGYIGNKGHFDALKIFKRANIKNSTLLFVCPEFIKFFNFSIKNIVKLLINFHKVLYKKDPYFEIAMLQFFVIKQLIGIEKQNIKFVYLNRKELINCYKAADIFLFPSRIECSPLVLFECMASRTPFLATDVGNVKEIINWSKSGIIIPTKQKITSFNIESIPLISEASNLLYELSTNFEKRKIMAENGFKNWLENFTWEEISTQYESLYKNLLP